MATRVEYTASGASAPTINEVRLVGRVSVDPEERSMPSGDALVSVRLVVRREPGDAKSRQSVDTIDCAVWRPRLQKSVARWRAGDTVEVQGALRRRFFRTTAGAVSRVEVEVSRARVIRRSTNG